MQRMLHLKGHSCDIHHLKPPGRLPYLWIMEKWYPALSGRGGLVLTFLVLCSWCSAQGEHPQPHGVSTQGTFQLLTIEPKMREVFTTDLYTDIEAHREEYST